MIKLSTLNVVYAAKMMIPNILYKHRGKRKSAQFSVAAALITSKIANHQSSFIESRNNKFKLK